MQDEPTDSFTDTTSMKKWLNTRMFWNEAPRLNFM